VSIPEVSSRSRLLAFLQGALKKLNSLTIGNYTFPTSDGTEDQVLTTDGAGTLTFEDAGGGGGGGISWDGSTADGVATYKNASEASVEANLTFDGSTLTVTGDTSITGDTTLGNASSDTVTFNAKNIVLTNVAAMGGTDDTVLVYNGSSIVTDEIDSKVWAGDLVDYTGTPVNNQVAIWTDTDTLEGDSGLTFNGNTLTIAEPTSADTLVVARASGQASIKAATSDHMIIDSDGQYLSLNHYEDDNVVLGYGGGNVGVGPNAAPAHLLTVATDVSAEAVASVTQYNNSTADDGPNLILQRARGTMASPAIVQEDDNLGSLRWYSYDGSNFDLSAGIHAECAGTPGSNDTPGRLIFSTTANGANTLTEQMSISRTGVVAIAGALTAAKAEISTSNTGLTNDRALFVQNTADNCSIEVDAATDKEANLILSENGTEKWIIGNRYTNDKLRIRNAEFTDTVLELTQTGDLDIAGALTLGAGVTSALGSEITTDLSTVDDWTKVAEADLNDPLAASYQMATAAINVLLIGYEGSEEMYLATCNILAHKYAPTRSHLQVDIIQDEGSVAWDTSDFSLTQNTSVAELWVKAPAANHTCYATITNGTTGGNTKSPSAAKSDWILTPNQTWGSLVPLTDTATTTNVKKRFDSLVIDGDLTVTGNDIKGSGGTAITLDISNNVTVAGDLTVAGGDIRNGGLVPISLSGQNVTLGNNLTIPGQVVPGYDPGIIAQTILNPSTATAFSITNSNTDLYRVIWSSGDTSTTDPKVQFDAPANGYVMVEIDCWEEDTSTGGSGPYVWLALSTTGDKTSITRLDSSIVAERAFWYAEQEQRGFKSARFYVSGLSGGATYTWHLYARRWSSSGGSNILRCGGDYPLFEMRVRPTYSNASIYNT